METPNNQTIVNRVDLYRRAKKINTYTFESSIGLSNGVLRKAIQNNTSLRSDNIEKVISHYPDINPIWLLTGKGEMLINPNAAQSEPNTQNHSIETTETTQLNKEIAELNNKIKALESTIEVLKEIITTIKQ